MAYRRPAAPHPNRDPGGYAGRLDSGADALYDYVTLEQEAGERLSKLLDYAQRKSDEDTRVDTYQAMVGKAMALYVDFLRATAFETPEVLSIPEERLESFYAQKPELTLYRRYFHNIQRRRAHTLSDAEERLLAAAGDMAQAPDDIFSKLTDADLTFSPAVDSRGVQHPLSNASYTLLMASEDRALRKSAFEGLYASYGGMKNTLAAVLSSQVKQLQFFATARKYPSALSASLDANHVPEPVYHTLIRTVRANLDKMHRYVRLRRKLLGVDALHMYDVYAPMVSGGVPAFPYDQAKETVYQAMAPLGRSTSPSSGRRWTTAGSMYTKTWESVREDTCRAPWSTPISCSTIRTIWTACSPWPMSWGTPSTPTAPTGTSPPSTGTM